MELKPTAFKSNLKISFNKNILEELLITVFQISKTQDKKFIHIGIQRK